MSRIARGSTGEAIEAAPTGAVLEPRRSAPQAVARRATTAECGAGGLDRRSRPFAGVALRNRGLSGFQRVTQSSAAADRAVGGDRRVSSGLFRKRRQHEGSTGLVSSSTRCRRAGTTAIGGGAVSAHGHGIDAGRTAAIGTPARTSAAAHGRRWPARARRPGGCIGKTAGSGQSSDSSAFAAGRTPSSAACPLAIPAASGRSG